MSRDMEIVNAVIKKATVEIEDHGILTAWLDLDYGNSCQGFGGYCLGSSTPLNDKYNIMGHFIRRVLEVVGVYKWDDLAGKTIRVKKVKGLGVPIYAIGNIIKDNWFSPSDDYASLEEKEDE